MTKKLLLLSCAASSLLATNGVNMIGTGTVSRSMGGTGVAFFSSGSDAMNKNTALIADVKESELHLDVTYFNATVTSTVYDQMVLNTTPSYDGPVTATSQNHLDTNFIPTLSYASKLDDTWSWGASMFGVAGLGVDYKDELAQRQLKTGMMLMKIIPGISYRTGNTTFGFAPVLGLGSMSINYDEDQSRVGANGEPLQSTREGLFGTNIGGSDLVPAFGWQAGMDIKVTDKLRIGTTYQSSLKYKYKDVANFNQFGPHGMVLMANDYLKAQGETGFSENSTETTDAMIQALIDSGMPADAANTVGQLMPAGLISDSLKATNPKNLNDLVMEQPWEVAIGFGYELTDKVTVTGDYRYIAWGLAEGYKDFGWENQSVYALGFEFRPNKQFRFRGGYNYADSPIKNVSGEMGSLLTDVQGTYVFDQAISMLNMVGFPAIATTHFTLGAGYDFSENLTIDAAFMYSPETETSRSGSLVPGATSALTDGMIPTSPVDMNYEYSTKMEQMTLSMGVNYRF